MDDLQLLRQYVEHRSRPALDELIRRHVGMVYAAALREVRDPHLAEDVAQAAFLLLMRRSAALARRKDLLLAGWIFRVVQFTAADARRARVRRERHEILAAQMHSDMSSHTNSASVEETLPLLNECIADLGAHDRDAVVMCYLQGCSYREAAEAQRVTENALRQRLFRAMRKLRMALGRRGINACPSAIGAALARASAQSAPPHLAAAISSTLDAIPATANAAALANGYIRSMFMAKMKLAITGCVAAMLAAGAGSMAVAVLAADAPAPAQAAPSAPATPAATQPTTAPSLGPAADPKQTVKNATADIEAGDDKGFLSCFDHPTDNDAKTLRTVVRVLAAGTALRKAAVDKFGQDAGDQVIALLGGGVMQTGFIDNMTVNVNGSKADLSQGATVLHLVKVGDEWKMTDDGTAVAKAGAFFDNLDSQLDTVKQMTADVKAGKYASFDDLKKAIVQVVMPKQDNGNGL